MADVKIVDVAGEQWNIKDEVAQKRIDELETKTNIKRKSLWREGDSFLELIEINGLKYFNGYFQNAFEIKSVGQIAFRFEPIEGMTKVNRGLITGDKIDGTGRCPVVLSIGQSGSVHVFAILNDIGQGTHPPITLYGQFFQLVV